METKHIMFPQSTEDRKIGCILKLVEVGTYVLSLWVSYSKLKYLINGHFVPILPNQGSFPQQISLCRSHLHRIFKLGSFQYGKLVHVYGPKLSTPTPYSHYTNSTAWLSFSVDFINQKGRFLSEIVPNQLQGNKTPNTSSAEVYVASNKYNLLNLTASKVL